MKNTSMIQIPFYQVDAFTSQPFAGNPAGVCPLSEWLPDETLQAIATENNVSETAFFVPTEGGYHLRWFTPGVEVDLCGHATLAASWVLFNKLGYSEDTIRFHTRSGLLEVSKHGDEYGMDFPATMPESIPADPELLDALGIKESDISACWKAPDIIVVMKDKATIDALEPDMNKLVKIKARGVICTTTNVGEDCPFDIVSRWFGPQVGVNEDPVTGSAHTWIIPLWASLLGRSEFLCQQGGDRKGELRCVLSEDGTRVSLYGQAVMTVSGVFHL